MKTLLSTLCLLGIMIAGFGQTFSISGVTTNPGSPERVQPGVFVTVNFSYTKPAGDALIYLLPMYMGNVTEGCYTGVTCIFRHHRHKCRICENDGRIED